MSHRIKMSSICFYLLFFWQLSLQISHVTCLSIPLITFSITCFLFLSFLCIVQTYSYKLNDTYEHIWKRFRIPSLYPVCHLSTVAYTIKTHLYDAYASTENNYVRKQLRNEETWKLRLIKCHMWMLNDMDWGVEWWERGERTTFLKSIFSKQNFVCLTYA